MIELHSFAAMGTGIDVAVELGNDPKRPEAAFARVEAEFERLEQLLSRFRPDSELSRLNRDGSIVASRDLCDVVGLALAARERTGGRFDPTVHDALVAAGYDRSFELVEAEGDDASHPVGCGLGVRQAGARIELYPGARLDLGGIGKGYAVDRAADVLSAAGPCLVNAGGDIAVRGGAWPIGVDGAMTVELTGGGLATSGRDRRHWRRSGRELHHLIDPATGEPAETDVLRATAVGGSAVEAEVLAKWLFLLGERAALESGISCILVTSDGSVRLGGELA